MSFLADNASLLWQAFLTTLSLAVISGICALVLGTLLTAMRVSPVAPLRGAATF
jgi:glutamate transport system permease protein